MLTKRRVSLLATSALLRGELTLKCAAGGFCRVETGKFIFRQTPFCCWW